MNARIGDMQAKPITWDELDRNEEIELAPSWERQSQDKNMNAQGRALCTLMDGMHLLALNGMHLFPLTDAYTCHTASHGHSVVDYALMHINAMKYVHKFELGSRIPDHIALHMHLDMDLHQQQQPRQIIPEQPRMKETHGRLYRERVASHLHQYPPVSWVELKQCMQAAAKEVLGEGTKKHLEPIKGLPHKPWYDKECKEARKNLKQLTGDAYKQAEKQFHAMRRKKRDSYVIKKQELDAHEMAKNPKKTWDGLKAHKEEVTVTFTENDMLTYVENLYNIPGAQPMHEYFPDPGPFEDCFTAEEVTSAINRLTNGKACDTNGLYAEMLKWLPEEGIAYITDILNHAYHNGLPLDWQDHWIKALHKGGNKNERTDAVTYVPTRGHLKMRHMYCCFAPDMPTFEPDLSHYYISKIMYVIS